MKIELILGIWGTVVSTCLAILEVRKAITEKPHIRVNAEIVMRSASETDDTHGVKVQTRHGDDVLCEEVDVEITVVNAGLRSLQITAVFVETENVVFQILPSGLPVVLDPQTSCTALVQPEWFVPSNPVDRQDEGKGSKLINVLAIGVLDALGTKHQITKSSCIKLLNRCKELPLRAKLYRHKETGNLVGAFQVKDQGKIIRKANRS